LAGGKALCHPAAQQPEKRIGQMRYEAPSTLDKAVALLAAETGEARVLAGGTDLLVQMKTDIIEPVLVVDIKGIAELREVKEEAGGFRIGAAVSGAELKEHPKLKSVWPGLVEATNLIGSTQIQGRATLGGNLCNGSPAADSVPALIAAEAKASIVGPKGRRDLAVEDVMLAPRKLALSKGEIIASFLLPAKPARTADAYLRFIPRTEMDIAVVGCGICLTLDAKGVCTAARVSLGAVAARPLLVADAAAALIGTKVDDAALEKLDAAARAACQPIDDKRGTKEYRIKVAGVLARRVAQIALERARKG
jgi:CO/xanthine dehydrogenase FAD-binding subunit